MMPRVLAHVRDRLGRGLLLVLPLVITVWLVRVLFSLIAGTATPWVLSLLRAVGIQDPEGNPARMLAPLIGVVLTVAFIYGLGVLGGNLAGRRVLALVEAGILRIPLVKGIYGAAKQLLEAFSATSQKRFSKVVLVEYPRADLWTVGFVTSDVEHHVNRGSGAVTPGCVTVFLPTTPNPTSGWMIVVPREDLVPLDLTIEEGIKLVVSGGIVAPGDIGTRIQTWEAGTASATNP